MQAACQYIGWPGVEQCWADLPKRAGVLHCQQVSTDHGGAFATILS